MNTLDRDDLSLHDHIRATLEAVARTTPVDEFEIAVSPLRHRRPLAMWAAAAAIIVLAGSALWARDATNPSPTTPATAPAAAHTYLIPSSSMDGRVLYTGTRQGPIESDSGAAYVPWADRVYAPAGGFDSPRQLIGVTVTGSALCPEGDPVDIDGYIASVCDDFYDATGVSWTDADGAVSVVAGGLTTMPRLVRFAGSLAQLRQIGDGATAPDGWVLLSDNRELITNPSRQVAYTIGPPNADAGLEYVEVRMWSQLPNSALYAIGFPLTGEAVTVRGVPAILDAKEPDNVFLFWAEPSGLIVSVQALGGDRASIIAFAEGLRTTGQAGFEEFLADAVGPPFALPRDQLPGG